jgi:hypothetical protein
VGVGVGTGVGVLVGGGVLVGVGMGVVVGEGELQPKRARPITASATSTTSLILRIVFSKSMSKNQRAALRPLRNSIPH